MNFFTNASIKRKQVLIILLTSAATLLLACLAFVWYDLTTFRKEMVVQASSLAEVIGNNCTAAVDFNDSRSAEETLGALRGEVKIVAAMVYKRDGSVFAKYSRDPHGTLNLIAPAQPAFDKKFTRDFLILSRPIMEQDEPIGTITLVYDLKELSVRFMRYLMIVGVVFGASLFVAFILSSRLQRVISDPIQSLARAARAVSFEKDYSVRVTKRSQDELGQLIDAFNEMLTQIQQRDAALQAARDHLENRVQERTEALAGSLSLLNATLESTADGILVVDRNGKPTKCNAKFLEIWQIAPKEFDHAQDGEVLKLNAAKVKDSERFVARIYEILEAPDQQSHDVLELTDGRVLERISQPQRVDGQFIGRVWCFRDITEHKRAEEALRERLALQERLATIAATVPGVIHTFKRSADGSFCMPYASPRVEEIYGVKPEALEEDASIMKELIHPEDVGMVYQSIEESFKTRQPWRAEFRVCNPVRGEIWVEGHSTPEPDSDGSMLWHGFLSNITERKMLETKMAGLNKELIEISRQAGMAEVATGVLHNVGNVLNSVNISATLVADTLKKTKAANLSKVVTLLDQNAATIGEFMNSERGRQLPRYLQQLVDQLTLEQQKSIGELDLLRKNIEHIKDIVAMQQNYAKVSGISETVDPVELVEDAVQMNIGALNRHDVQVVREFQPVPLITVEKHKVLQILVNLIRNAKYACDDAGRSDKRMTLRLFKSEKGISIAVSDNGVGIPAENMTRIFNHGFTTRKTGHGFGLHSGALVAKEMGGVLRVHSEGHGKGATFTLELPLQIAKGRHV
ncbi:MAG TPA: PAS domain S-box protein [Verrucomicrobiae bacterium]|nr:PAS domain S-box protein [Verrucomicrobiae bacterium]